MFRLNINKQKVHEIRLLGLPHLVNSTGGHPFFPPQRHPFPKHQALLGTAVQGITGYITIVRGAPNSNLWSTMVIPIKMVESC